ncbi:MAG: 50S ribosomal protein L23 [Planctomycetota bacterium]
MEDHNIIFRPLITEQGTHLAGKVSAYAFEVNKDANKQQVKGAVERLYGVKVSKVRTANRKGKLRRKGKTWGFTADWKKAVVYLEPDYHIDLF